MSSTSPSASTALPVLEASVLAFALVLLWMLWSSGGRDAFYEPTDKKKLRFVRWV